MAKGGQLGVAFVQVGTEVQATLQLKGFAAVKAYAGKSGRLVSADANMDASFRFDPRGHAMCTLADTAEVRLGLQNFDVIVHDI